MCPLRFLNRRFAILAYLAAIGTAGLRGQPGVAPTDVLQTVHGSVQPPPRHTLRIEASDGRGSGEIKPDGTFQFLVRGLPKETVNVIVRDGTAVLYNNTQTLGTPWEMQIAPLGREPPEDPAVGRAILWSLVFSVMAGLVELQFRSKADLTSCVGKSSIIYILLLCFFNTVAAALAAGLLKNKIPGGPFFTPMFYALFGVFAFETVLSNTNVTIFEKGVLAFQEWTGKARDPAVNAVQRRQTQKENDRIRALGDKLLEIPDDKLTTYVLDAFGESGEKLIEDSKAYGTKYGANPKLYLALAFARGSPDRAASTVKLKQSG